LSLPNIIINCVTSIVIVESVVTFEVPFIVTLEFTVVVPFIVTFVVVPLVVVTGIVDVESIHKYY